MGRLPIDELLHRVNNLLGTIQLQVAAATALDDKKACLDALRLIAESGERTRDEVQRFRASNGPSVTSPGAS